MITCVKETPSGEILVGTQQGLYILEGAFVTALTMKDGLPNDAVISISIDGADGTWVGTKAGGLDRIVNHKVVRAPAGAGLPAFQIYSVLDDQNGMLWMGSTRGVLKVSRAQLHEWSEGRRKTLDVAVLGKSDGMRSSECGGLSQPPAARLQDGSLWFATAKGFAHANPAQIIEPPPPASPRVSGSDDRSHGGRVARPHRDSLRAGATSIFNSMRSAYRTRRSFSSAASWKTTMPTGS